METQWLIWALLTAMAGAACAVSAGMVRGMRRTLAANQRETNSQLSAMAATVEALQARVEELALLAAQKSAGTSDGSAPDRRKELPEPETVAVLAAAATTLIGKEARIRTAKLLPAEQSGAGMWAQQGRAFVQTSHNPRSR